MKIEVKEAPDAEEIEVLIRCPAVNDKVRGMVSALRSFDRRLVGRKDGEYYQIDANEILYLESVDRRVFLYTEDRTLETEGRLYELEALLKNHSFFRASRATLVNLMRVRSLRPELGSRLLLTMDNGEKIIVSRHYAGAIKNALGVH